jgi:hypothetical protein
MFGMAGVMGVLLALLLVYSLTANDLDVRVDQILRSEMAHLEEVPPANLPEVIERSVGAEAGSAITGCSRPGALAGRGSGGEPARSDRHALLSRHRRRCEGPFAHSGQAPARRE